MNGHDVHVKLDLDRIQRSEDPDITLAAGDVLWVPFTLQRASKTDQPESVPARGCVGYS